MDTEAFDTYLDENINQSQLALNAVGELNFSMANLNRVSRKNHQYRVFHKEVFSSIDIFLKHACTISHLFWPEIPQTCPNIGELDGERIRSYSESTITWNIKNRLGHDEKEFLKDKTLRNHFEEHLERFELTSPDSVSEYHFNGFPVLVAYSLLDRKSCHYDPISRNFHFNSKTYNMHEAAAVIFKLWSYACDERQKGKTAVRADLISSEYPLEIKMQAQME